MFKESNKYLESYNNGMLSTYSVVFPWEPMNAEQANGADGVAPLNVAYGILHCKQKYHRQKTNAFG